jgi:hypothetical protein
MERCFDGEWTTQTAGVGGFYAGAGVATPYQGGGALGQGTSGPAFGDSFETNAF